ncbi:MAG: phosphoribosylanthranilate isomerase [Cellvibrionales bacterium TMED47]|jgi:phosphoribosylanthranilate isomerase|nr:phosphoribosylanthranilate isomerase [Porticoccaceae bacterium]RPG82731.1 MAG: phosphoribosylanthranilate isomerase [Cellvibrionales bacterium TMED47]|tara:strand:- start:1371 stop:1985 length:615 start_codon:yes stop_codon:yes gene_type:complete
MTVRVKICGITSPEQALMAQQSGADAIGLVIYEKSPRYVDIEQAANIRAVIGQSTLAIALLVNPSESLVKQVISEVKPDYIQFHGDETAEFCHQFNVPFIRAVRMRDGLDIEAEVAAYKAEGGFLFDAWNDDLYGGTGHSFDWSRLPDSADYKLILAGGLNPSNVAQAVSITNPYMVDVSGGVEASPGVKDPVKVKAFITQAKK